MRTADAMDTTRAGLGETSSVSVASFQRSPSKRIDRRASSILDRAQARYRGSGALGTHARRDRGRALRRTAADDRVSSLITHERKGSEIHYSRHDAATGAYQTLAFVDNGKTLDVRDWNNAEA